MEFHHEMRQEQSARMIPLQIWEQSPFQKLKGGEVIKNMSLGYSDLEDVYKFLRAHLISANALVIGTTARNKSGKGGLMMGFWRLFNQDLYSQSWLAETETELEWRIIPFAHCDRAAKLPRDLYPELGLVDPSHTPATNTPTDERAISGLQWSLAQEDYLEKVGSGTDLSDYLRLRKKAVIWLVEASTTFVLPITTQVSVEVEGEDDLGVSTLCNLALDTRSRDHTFLFGIDSNYKLNTDPDSFHFREQAFAQDVELGSLSNTSTRIITQYRGKEVELSKLPPLLQRKIKRLLQISMAPKDAIAKQHKKKNDLNWALFERGIIPEPTDAGFFALLNHRLNLPLGRLLVPSNEWFSGDKDYDMGYLLNSYVLRKYPEILS